MTTRMADALKEAGQDFEWYPTTDAMIAVVARHMNKHSKNRGAILDIGAGDGRVLSALAERLEGCGDLYAIEKATVHIDNMPSHIAIVGTDFEGQTLIDKDVDVVFCNPPYSQYETWAVKIIKEALCNDAYLILPKRWANSKGIKSALEARDTKAKVLWSGDFTSAERKARASVDILHVSLCERRNEWDCHPHKTDPFETWFHATFPEVEVIDTLKEETPKDRINGDLLRGYNLVDRLTELYQRDMERLHASYRALCSIDPALLKEVGVTAEQVKDGLRKKIAGLKNLYWQELFDHLDKIKARLTNKSCESILKKMASAVHVDFTADNAYAVVLWVLKNANLYIESQLTDLFTTLSAPENIRNYKSNQKTWDREQWRFLHGYGYEKKKPPSHYMLEYRVITQQYYGCGIKPNDKEWRSGYDYPGGLHRDSHELLQDIMTVANNLDFPCLVSTDFAWSSGSPQVFMLNSGEVLMRVKAYVNGNLHIQFNQDFIKALNIEASRLLGWIRSPKEACDEMGVDFFTAERCFGSNRIFAKSEYKLLTAGKGKDDDIHENMAVCSSTEQ